MYITGLVNLYTLLSKYSFRSCIWMKMSVLSFYFLLDVSDQPYPFKYCCSLLEPRKSKRNKAEHRKGIAAEKNHPAVENGMVGSKRKRKTVKVQ